MSVNGKIHALIHNQLKSVNPSESSITECHQEIKDALNKQILFLQDELRSKDEIIKLLINERNVTNNDYSVHKQNVKRKNTNSSNENNKDVSKEPNNTSINMDNNSEYVVVGKKKNTKRRSITIMGDSMLKEVDPFKMRKDLKDTSDRLYVHSFKGATVEHMRHYAKPLMGFKPDIEKIVKHYESHPSVLKIKENIQCDEKFKFKDLIEEDIHKEIMQLNLKKASIENDLPTELLKESMDIVSDYLSNIYNNSKTNELYPNSLKMGTVTPINKKSAQTLLKKDQRPVNLIPIVSKLYERIMYDEIYKYVDKFLSSYLFGYRKMHSTQQCLIIMIEAWKKALDSKNSAGAVLTDLSKAFDCLNHKLLIAKLDAYGFHKESLKFIYNYLKDRKQRTKVNN